MLIVADLLLGLNENVNEIEIKRLKQEERIALAKMTPKQQQEYYKLKKQFEMGESKQREKKKRRNIINIWSKLHKIRLFLKNPNEKNTSLSVSCSTWC